MRLFYSRIGRVVKEFNSAKDLAKKKSKTGINILDTYPGTGRKHVKSDFIPEMHSVAV